MYQEIVIIEDNLDVSSIIKSTFRNETNYIFKSIQSLQFINIIDTLPDLIIINEDNLNINIIDICDCIRNINENSITPIIVVGSNTDKNHRLEILKHNVEYYIKSPIDEDYLFYTIINIINLLSINRKISPLTGLPGNVQIQIELKKHLLRKDEFAILYFDLDHFKEYNDTYRIYDGR